MLVPGPCRAPPPRGARGHRPNHEHRAAPSPAGLGTMATAVYRPHPASPPSDVPAARRPHLASPHRAGVPDATRPHPVSPPQRRPSSSHGEYQTYVRIWLPFSSSEYFFFSSWVKSAAYSFSCTGSNPSHLSHIKRPANLGALLIILISFSFAESYVNIISVLLKFKHPGHVLDQGQESVNWL